MKSLLLLIAMIFSLHASTVKELEKACDLNNRKSCTSLGILYQIGKAVPQDNKKAREYYDKACQLKDSEACILLGDLFYYGIGVDQDNHFAKQYYTEACHLKDQKGCKSFQRVEQEEQEEEEKRAELERLKKEREELLFEVDLLDKI